jgi:3-oxoadipate enol-lactonase
MGGMIAQCLALARPERLRSLTLASTFAEPGAWCTRLFALWRDIADEQGVPFVLRDMLQWAFTPEFVDAHVADIAAVESELEEAAMPLAAYQAQLAAVAGHNTTGRLGGIAVPTLVLAGERDILVPVELTRRVHAEIPGARWATIPGGHACAWEAPDAFNAAVLAFLGDVVT